MIRYGPDQTDRSLGVNQKKQTYDWEWARANRPATGYGPDETDRCLGIGQTEETKVWVWTRRNRPMFGYWPDRTYPIQVWARQNRPNFGMGQTERRDRKFVQAMSSVARDPSVRDPGPFGSYLSGVADFILGCTESISKKKQI